MGRLKPRLTNGFLLAAIGVGLGTGCATHEQSGTGRAGGPQSGSASSWVGADSNFAREACQATATQVEIGKLAAANTRNKELRSFAKRLAEDQSKAEKELDQLFARKGIPPEAELEPNFQISIDRLIGLKGGEFD